MQDILYLVVPCYNEQEVLEETTRQLTVILEDLIKKKAISEQSRILYVDDGSKDRTWDLISEFHRGNRLVMGARLSRNRGHQNALLAGMFTAAQKADMVISLDADLQDDVGAIPQFVKEYYKGAEIVYGVRNSRATDTKFKRGTAQLFYKLLKWMGADIVYNHADYRLMSKRAVLELKNYKEVNLFLRGIVPMIGFKSSTVYYERHERFAGESKYPLRKMLSFAMDGITSLSVRPLRMITVLGFLIFLISIVMLVYFLVGAFFGDVVLGWPSLIISIWAIGGLQILGIGVIGEYIGKIYLETKERPKYVIEEILD